jgi:hypothetical protein
MRGFPGLLLLGPNGSPQPTQVVRGGGLTFERLPITTVALGRGQVAYFNVGFTDVAPTLCVIATKVEVTPPTATAYSVVAVSPTMNACNGGTLNVSPVFSSSDTTATQTTAPSP